MGGNSEGWYALDLAVVAIANTANVLLACMFLARAAGRAGTGHILGTGVVAMGVPLCAAVALNIVGGRGIWAALLPAPFIAYCALEFVLDYVLKSDFRRTRMLGPYLLLYYAGLMGMIGYAFLVDKVAGFVTLATYFANLGATFYSFARVGHGPPA
jgi:hypothetical protein